MPAAKLIMVPSLSGAAGPYYVLFPVEPTPSSTVSDWLTADKPGIALKSERIVELLDAIAANVPAGGNALVTCHGNTHGLKLFFGDPKNKIQLETEAMDSVKRNQDGKETDEQTRQILKLSATELTALKASLEKVQKLGLNRIDVRACNVGSSATSMSQLQIFFNCSTFCAPKILDSFGVISYGAFSHDPASLDAWLKTHAGAVVSGSSPDRFWLYQDLSKGVQTDAFAESPKAVQDWVAAHLPPNGHFTSKSQLSYHALTDMKTTMVFAGEAGFRAELAEATKGNAPSRRIDINQPVDLRNP